ncbi:hypothetical protein E2562_036512 [Oryza meyeriana var. granulata]|uniref:Uncharacterized protein n=1 Tax=Oryza meyeriana var. granulata TaxID=110450 RepID=A0A6G1FG83_9ORYZ|nr:hypothetical protein E2562_036512 [Oryza meyeriana var. granulata]
MVYQQAHGHAGYPGADYDQNAIINNNPAYPAGYDQNAIYNYPAYPAGYVQNVFSNYPGYQAAYDQNALPKNCVSYAAHQYSNSSVPVNVGAAADVVSMNRQVQTSGGAATIAVTQAADHPSDGAFQPTPTGGAQM